LAPEANDTLLINCWGCSKCIAAHKPDNVRTFESKQGKFTRELKPCKSSYSSDEKPFLIQAKLYIYDIAGKSPQQHLADNCSASDGKTKNDKKECSHNLMSVTHKVSNHHLHHEEQ
jgi:hypothetical protein